MSGGAKTEHKTSLKICYWNIQGTKFKAIKDKLSDGEF